MEPMIEVFRKVNACSRLIFLECLEATKLVRFLYAAAPQYGSHNRKVAPIQPILRRGYPTQIEDSSLCTNVFVKISLQDSFLFIGLRNVILANKSKSLLAYYITTVRFFTVHIFRFIYTLNCLIRINK